MQVRNLLLYQVADKKVQVSVYFERGTFWLTQKAMAMLFGVKVPAISKHLKNIFDSGELEEPSVISKMEITAEDGKNYGTKFYRLEAVLGVGYRVNSIQATDFRKWATTTLNEFIIKGFVLDDERLKQGKNFVHGDAGIEDVFDDDDMAVFEGGLQADELVYPSTRLRADIRTHLYKSKLRLALQLLEQIRGKHKRTIEHR
jgi:hypothetical protein